MKQIEILLAENNEIVRRVFKMRLELEDDLKVVGEADNGRQAVALVKELRPALVLMDVVMPLLNGLHAAAEIAKDVPATKVVMLSMYDNEAYVEAAIDAGAMGYLIKQTDGNILCHAIREVHKGNRVFSPLITLKFGHRMPKAQTD
jgi:DNA-binding NarL/FixJ family response regulator